MKVVLHRHVKRIVVELRASSYEALVKASCAPHRQLDVGEAFPAEDHIA